MENSVLLSKVQTITFPSKFNENTAKKHKKNLIDFVIFCKKALNWKNNKFKLQEK